MADISKVTLPNNETYDLKDSVARGGIGNAKLFYGTCSSAAAATEKAVTCSEFTANDLVAGTMINVKFDATNSGAVASLTLNVNGTGAKSIKYIYNDSRNNIPGASYLSANNMYTFRYDGTYWVVQLMYNTNSNYDLRDYYFRPYAGSTIYRYKLCLLGEDNRLYPIVTTNQTSTTQVAKAVQTVGLKPENIWQYYSTTTTNAGAVVPGQVLYQWSYAYLCEYNFNATIPTYTTVYLRGTYNKDKDLFYLYDDGASATTSYYTTVPTNTANITLSDYFVSGYYYLLVGGSYSSANYMSLFGNHPLYYFDGTNLIPVSTKVAKDLVDNAPYVPTTRKINNKVLSSDITLTASDVSAVPTTRKVNNKALSSDITLSASDVSAVPATRKVNNKALSSDITLTASDVGAASSTHTHTTTIAAGGTSQLNLAANTAYTLTAGGTTYVFKTPADSDTKNTTGSTNTSSEIYLVGATTQAANPQTYSHDTARVRANGMVASSGYEFATASAMGTTKATMVYDSTIEAIAFQFA